MAAEHPAKRRRTAPPSDADDNALPEPEPEKPALQAGEEPVIAEYSAEQSTGAPSTPSPETDTTSQTIFRDISDTRDRLYHADRMCGFLPDHNAILNPMHMANARHLAEPFTFQRGMREILKRVGLHAKRIGCRV